MNTDFIQIFSLCFGTFAYSSFSRTMELEGDTEKGYSNSGVCAGRSQLAGKNENRLK